MSLKAKAFDSIRGIENHAPLSKNRHALGGLSLAAAEEVAT
jgi:hypothetical protein